MGGGKDWRVMVGGGKDWRGLVGGGKDWRGMLGEGEKTGEDWWEGNLVGGIVLLEPLSLVPAKGGR